MDFAPIFLWWFVVLVMGLAAYPIAFVLLRHFPDKGYAFSKVLALLLTGYFAWILGYASFNPGTILLSFLLMAGLSVLILVTWLGEAFKKFFAKNLAQYLVLECLFLTAFLVAGAYKMRTYEIGGPGEKPMDFAFLNGILASPSMPPVDPWLAGGNISYYYFGYFVVAMLTKVTGVPSGVAFNLMVALVWSLSALCAFSIAYALTRRYRYSVLSAAALTVLGNLDYWHRAVQAFQVGNLSHPYYNQPIDPNAEKGLSGAISYLLSPLQHGWDYFQASRIVPVPPSDKLINEFPAFSFFLSDLHPHLMAIPFVLLAIATAYSLLKAGSFDTGVYAGSSLWKWAQGIVMVLIFGVLSFSNSWDFPTLMLLLGLCLFLQQWWTNEGDFNAWAKAVVKVGVPLVIGAFAFYLPFYVKFQSQASGLGLVKDRTDIYYLIVIFGFFFSILIPAILGKALNPRGSKSQKSRTKRGDELVCVLCGEEAKDRKFCGHCGGEVAPAGGADIAALPDDSTRNLLRKAGGLFSSEGDPSRGWMALGVVLLFLIGFNFAPLQLSTLLTAALFVFFTLLALASTPETKEMIFTLLMVMIGFLLIAGCEVLFIKDHFSDGALYRMNTVFKFHYQVWILFSLSTGPLLKWLVENLYSQWAGWKRGLWAGAAIFTLVGALFYPGLAFSAKMRGSSPESATLDGEVYYEHNYPSDFAMAQWIKQNVKPVGSKVPVILEAWGGSYQQQYGTLATMTGYPTVLGWDFHEAQWRGSWDKPVVRGGDVEDTLFRRRDDIDAIYTSSDLNKTRDLLRRYRVDYVYVGDAERAKYKDHPENLGKFSSLGTLVQQSGNSFLYKVNP
ncbi:MAG TPA: DUF2298 domain-containing protein [bacterium]|nr:DUF2298 domain-containing protein [bacterium]